MSNDAQRDCTACRHRIPCGIRIIRVPCPLSRRRTADVHRRPCRLGHWIRGESSQMRASPGKVSGQGVNAVVHLRCQRAQGDCRSGTRPPVLGAGQSPHRGLDHTAGGLVPPRGVQPGGVACPVAQRVPRARVGRHEKCRLIHFEQTDGVSRRHLQRDLTPDRTGDHSITGSGKLVSQLNPAATHVLGVEGELDGGAQLVQHFQQGCGLRLRTGVLVRQPLGLKFREGPVVAPEVRVQIPWLTEPTLVKSGSVGVEAQQKVPDPITAQVRFPRHLLGQIEDRVAACGFAGMWAGYNKDITTARHAAADG
ncbi:hypothetical protein SRB5_67340 [Streptomyces sp. RB5]|uniref:Uncharacterized protein n=1 Tax=Streptomyces smaragdinus TaxID=2585196 RepID=A0A7K0CSS2_9ACTN|nr:hypothetical protein [Streptomyces smaragdinus]